MGKVSSLEFSALHKAPTQPVESHNQRDGCREPHDGKYSLVFISMDDFKFMDANRPFALRFMSKSIYKKLLLMSRKGYVILFGMWFVCFLSFMGVLTNLFVLPQELVMPCVAVSMFMFVFRLLCIDDELFLDNLKSFDMVYLVVNVFVFTYLLGVVSTGDLMTWMIIWLYFLCYVNALFLDSAPMSFSKHERGYKDSLKSQRLQPLTQNNRSPPLAFSSLDQNVENGSHGNLIHSENEDHNTNHTVNHHISLSPWSIRNVYRMLLGINSHEEQEGNVQPRRKGKSLMNTVTKTRFSIMFSMIMGIMTQIYLHFVIQMVEWDTRNKVVLEFDRFVWTIRDLLAFTSVNIVIFMIKRTFKVAFYHARPSCYQRGLLRVPIIPVWSQLIELKSEMKMIEKFPSSPSSGSLSHSAPCTSVPENQSHPGSKEIVNFQTFLTSRSFLTGVCVVPRSVIENERIVGVFDAEEISIKVRADESVYKRLLKRLSPSSIKFVRKLRLVCFSGWVVCACAGYLSAWLDSVVVDYILMITAAPASLEIVAFLLDIPFVIYRQTLGNFESVFMIYNIFLLCFSLADYFNWAGARTWIGIPFMFFSLLQTIFYDIVKIPWKRLLSNTRLSKERLQELLRMPFTSHLIELLESKSIIGIGSSHHIVVSKEHEKHCNQRTKESIFLNSRMSWDELRFYHSLFGVVCIGYYAVIVLTVVYFYLCINMGYIHTPRERLIDLFFIESSNATFVRTSSLNLGIFAFKRLQHSIRNPLSSNGITTIYSRMPLTPTVLDSLQDMSAHNRHSVGQDPIRGELQA
eukprot:TRINITY_DN5548_c0_g1_i1.p1 TRINITY_DN5548_c0_g1~~TRINITY_DN5548_c0_g1_i1.p1  ORF type:complete len:801 (-),score=124.07 TRINITY_DN5548_c0_g1_i1:102-2504(-)